MMHIIVCLKQILDPELPPRDFRIDSEVNEPFADDLPLVMSTFDQNALEVALQIKDQLPNTVITALTLGPNSSSDVLRKALAVKVDQAVRIASENDFKLSAGQTAAYLAKAIDKIGHVDLILCGRQAGDWDGGQVGFLLAETLRWPCINLVTNITLEEDKLRLKREVERGYEVVELKSPMVGIVTNDATNNLRLAKVRDAMLASRQEINVYDDNDIQLDKSNLPGVEITKLFIPERNIQCEIIPGEDGEEIAGELVRLLQELKAI